MSQLFKYAARILKGVVEGTSSLKNALYRSDIPSSVSKKALLSITSNCLQYSDDLDHLIDTVPELHSFDSDPFYLRVVLYELLFGRGRLHGGGAVIRHIKQHKDSIKEAMQLLLHIKGFDTVNAYKAAGKKHTILRFARVNTLIVSVETVMNKLKEIDYSLVPFDVVAKAGKKECCVAQDLFVPTLLAFPAGHDLHACTLVQEHHLILQDKSSCFSALALQPDEGDRVIDACAAPGNKTLHLAALMRDKGMILACERDPKRCRLLQQRVAAFGATSIEVKQADFRHVSTEDSGPTCILLDPSCSGSGMLQNRHELQFKAKNQDDQKVAKLAKEQLELLLVAAAIPTVTKIVYSTCSVYKEENEDVVAAFLRKVGTSWSLTPTLQDWPRRGTPSSLDPSLCPLVVRVDPALDLTNGFFVASFARRHHVEISSPKDKTGQ